MSWIFRLVATSATCEWFIQGLRKGLVRERVERVHRRALLVMLNKENSMCTHTFEYVLSLYEIWYDKYHCQDSKNQCFPKLVGSGLFIITESILYLHKSLLEVTLVWFEGYMRQIQELFLNISNVKSSKKNTEIAWVYSILWFWFLTPRFSS